MSRAEPIDLTPRSEGAVFNLLRKRYAPPTWVLLPGVRDSTGFSASRTADGLAMGTWPSRGLELIGFEIKISRSDWLRELKEPSKAEPIARFCDRWFVVASSDDIVKVDELPPNWGLLVASGKRGLVAKRDAPMLKPIPVDRKFLAAILRGAQKHVVKTEEITAAVDAATERVRTMLEERHQRSIAGAQQELKDLQHAVSEFNEGLGLDYGEAIRSHFAAHGRQKIGAAVKFVLNGGMTSLQRELEQTHQRLLRMAEHVKTLMDESPKLNGRAEHELGAACAEMARRETS